MVDKWETDPEGPAGVETLEIGTEQFPAHVWFSRDVAWNSDSGHTKLNGRLQINEVTISIAEFVLTESWPEDRIRSELIRIGTATYNDLLAWVRGSQ